MLNLGRWAFLRNPKGNAKRFYIKIPSEIKYIKKVSDKVLSDLRHHNTNEETLFNIRLSVEEAVRNAIVHGNKSDRRSSVRINYSIEGGRIHIEVEDEGKGFDYKNLADPTIGRNIMRNSGRGVHLIENLMDRVDFNKTGNKIKMTKGLKTKGT